MRIPLNIFTKQSTLPNARYGLSGECFFICAYSTLFTAKVLSVIADMGIFFSSSPEADIMF